jgi:uncharacterized protein YdaU (DUF1376 family)
MEKNEALPYYKWLVRDYRANRKVHKMSWQAKGLYRELLDEFWIDGPLPNDLAALAEVCGCTRKEFDRYWPEIRGNFIQDEEGRWVNGKMNSQRTDKDMERVVKQAAGRLGGLTKIKKALESADELARVEKSVADAKQVLADAKQKNEAASTCHIAEQSRAGAEKSIPADKPPEETSLHVQCRTMVHAYWHDFHPEDDSAPWDASEAKQLKSLLSANPKLSADGFHRLLDHRARSDVNHSERPRKWLAILTDFKRSPLNEFKHPKEQSNGTSKDYSGSNSTRGAAVGRVERGQSAFRQAAIASVEAAGGFPAGPDDSGVPEPGAPPGHGEDVPARSGDIGGGVRDSSRGSSPGIFPDTPEILPPSERNPGGPRSHGSQRAH